MIDKYEIIKKIGNGNMGEVYLVRDTALNKNYAMKVAYKTKDNMYIDALKREFELMKNLSDRRIPYVTDYGENDEVSYLVMEYVEGTNFEEYLKKFAPLQYKKACIYISEICELISYLHNLKPMIIFRDLKPDNLIIDCNGHLRLFDFGGGILCQNQVDTMYAIGTYGYAAPEVLKCHNISTYSDVYSIGMILYYALTGINPALPPYEIGKANESEITVPESISNLVEKMTEKDYTKRILNADEIIYEIKNAKCDGMCEKMYMGYAIYYFMFTITLILAGYTVFRFCKSSFLNYGLLKISGTLCIISMTAKYFLDKKYNKKHFIRKREINIIYTEKKNVGLFL